MSSAAAITTTPSVRTAEPPSRFVDLVAAEWIKMRSLRSTYWVLVVSALAAIVVNLNAVHADLAYIDRPTPPGMPPVQYDPLFHGLNSIAVYLMMLAAASVGAISVFSEYATGMVRTTFAAVPDRGAVVAAKVVVITAVTLVLGVVISTASFFGTNALLASRHVGLSIGDPGCLRAVTAYALIVPVSALIGIAFGAVIRHATATVVALVTLLFIAPLMFGGDRYRILKEIRQRPADRGGVPAEGEPGQPLRRPGQVSRDDHRVVARARRLGARLGDRRHHRRPPPGRVKGVAPPPAGRRRVHPTPGARRRAERAAAGPPG